MITTIIRTYVCIFYYCYITSTISTPGARYATVDIKDFYVGTDTIIYEYIRIQLLVIPNTIIKHYNFSTIAIAGHVIVEMRRGIYGLP